MGEIVYWLPWFDRWVSVLLARIYDVMSCVIMCDYSEIRDGAPKSQTNRIVASTTNNQQNNLLTTIGDQISDIVLCCGP